MHTKFLLRYSVWALLLCMRANAIHAQSNLYEPAYFNDKNRLQKVAATKTIVDKLFADHAAKNNFPGMVYGIVVDGQLVYTGGTGYANISKKQVASGSSAFRIASMTKSITAMAIMQLRDRGKLLLDDPAATYIPELKKIKYLSVDAPAITIRHLLTHNAGFPEDNPWGDRQLADTDAELLALVSNDVQFATSPGTAYEYSNLGFALLGRIITVVSGKPYQAYITENILSALGMNNTWWEHTKVPVSQLALGYRWQNGKWVEEPLLHDGSFGAMGGLITTIDDFSKYIALHQSAWPPRNEKENPVLKRSSLREMQSTGTFSRLNARYRYPDGRACALASLYAYGLSWITDCDEKVWVGHSGGLPGFGSQWHIFPHYGIGVVAFANLTYAPTGAINTAVMDTIIKLANLKPAMVSVSPVLKERKAQIVALMPHWREAQKMAIFAENFFPDNPIEAIQKRAAELLDKAGRIVTVSELTAVNNLRGSFVMEGEKSNIRIFFTLTPEKIPRIQELTMSEQKK